MTKKPLRLKGGGGQCTRKAASGRERWGSVLWWVLLLKGWHAVGKGETETEKKSGGDHSRSRNICVVRRNYMKSGGNDDGHQQKAALPPKLYASEKNNGEVIGVMLNGGGKKTEEGQPHVIKSLRKKEVAKGT